MEAAAAAGGAVCPAWCLRQRPAAERAAYTAAAAGGDSSSGDDEHDSGASESDSSALDTMPNVSEQDSSDDDMSEKEEGQEEAAGAAPGRGRGGAQQQAGTSNTQHSKRRHTTISGNDGSSQVPKRQKTSSAAAKRGGKIYSHAVEVLPGGNRQVHMDDKIRANTRWPSSLQPIRVPLSLVTACFPDLPCEVNLELTVDGQAAGEGDLQAPITALLKLAESKRSDGRISSQVKCAGVAGVLHSYLGHTITRMAANINGQQLMLHLQSPAAVQAAAAAAAAEAATTGWHVHDYKGGENKTIGISFNSRQLYIPLKLFSSAFPGPPPLPFKVQLAVYKDGCLVGDPVDDVSASSNRAFTIPAALARQVSGCEVHQLKAAAPNTLQVHVKSTVPTPAAAGSAGAAGTAGFGPIAAAGPPQHGSNARSNRQGSAAAPAAAATPSGPDSQAGQQQQQQQQQAKDKRQRSAAAASRCTPTALPGVIDPVTVNNTPGALAAAQAAAAADGIGGVGTLRSTVKGQAAHTAGCTAGVPAALATCMDPKGEQQQQQQCGAQPQEQQQQPCGAAVHPRVRFADMSESEATADDAGGHAGRQQLQDTATQPEHQQQHAAGPSTNQQRKVSSSSLAGQGQCGLNSKVTEDTAAAPAAHPPIATPPEEDEAGTPSGAAELLPPTPTAKPATPATAPGPAEAEAVAAVQRNTAAAGGPVLGQPVQAAAATAATAINTDQVGLPCADVAAAAVAAPAAAAIDVAPLPAAGRSLQGFTLQPASASAVPLHQAKLQLLALLDHLQAPKEQLKRVRAAMQLLSRLPDGDKRRCWFDADYAEVMMWVRRQDVEEVQEAVQLQQHTVCCWTMLWRVRVLDVCA